MPMQGRVGMKMGGIRRQSGCMLLLVWLCPALSAVMAAPGGGPATSEAVPGLSTLYALENTDAEATGFSGVRQRAQHTQALRLGAQSGLELRSRQIREELESMRNHLDSIYNFSRLLLDGRVLPPVIVAGRRLFIQYDARSARETGKVYHIVRQARVVSTPPLWRDYLLHELRSVPVPEGLLPADAREKRHWRAAVTQGWQAGVRQADINFQHRLARLNRDYSGMLEYHRLYRRGLVDPPALDRTDRRLIVADSSLRMDDRLIRIVRDPVFSRPRNRRPVSR